MTQTILTIGNFDGVHKGHQKIIDKMIELCKSPNANLVALTFHPHPAEVLGKGVAFMNLFSIQERVEQLKSYGIKNVIVLPFTKELAATSPEAFFKKYVVDLFGATDLVVGHDFSFGKNRSGTLETLGTLCSVNKLTFTFVPAVKHDDKIISSTLIRNALKEGRVDLARLYLGRAYEISGEVVQGDRRGVKLGFPTVNLFLSQPLTIKTGVYVTMTEWDSKVWRSVTNIGYNPTFKTEGSGIVANNLKIETHILDFNQEIYGQKLKTFFLGRLRDEIKFPSVEALKAQIKKDVEDAKNFK